MMKMVNSKLLRRLYSNWRKMEPKIIPASGCGFWCWHMMDQEYSIPKDVPKGHLVVYVGENYKRFIIKITLLDHPLFRVLLDQAQDMYDFTTTNSKLCIPCDENVFINIVRCAGSLQEQIKVHLHLKRLGTLRRGFAKPE